MTQATTKDAGGDEGDLTTAQAAEMLGISRRYLYELIAAGEIATIRLPLGPEHRIERAEIKRFRDRNRQRAGAPATA
jgi:excisionase family DNA binding protein